MPSSLFPKGLPLSHLSPAARGVAKQLDASRLVQRSDATDHANGTLSADEVRAGLAAIDNFNPEEQQALRQMAALLGVDGAGQQAAPKAWLDRDPPPKGRYEARTAFAVGDFIYVQDDAYNMRTSGLLRYDVANDQWSELALPDGFSTRVTNVSDGWRHSAMAAAGDQLYMVGGEASRKHVEWAYRFDPAQKQWHRIANVKARSSIALAGGEDGKLYAFGGEVQKDDPNDPGRPADGGMGAFVRAMGGNAAPARRIRRQIDAATDLAQAYDPASNQWTDLPPLPVARREGKAIAAAGKLFVIGGRDDKGNHMNRVDVFDPATGQWQDPMRMPTALRNPSVWVEDGKIHVTGGESKGTETSHGCNTVHEVLDPVTGVASDGPTVRAPDEASNIQVVPVGERLFAMGGTALARNADTFLYEWAAEEPPAPTTVVNNVINTTVNNTIVHNDVDITNVVTNITNLTHVQLIDDRDVNIHVHHTSIDITNIDQDITQIDASVELLQPMQSARQGGFFDPDRGFFLRTEGKGKALVGSGVDADGRRQLVGRSHDGMGAAPRSAGALFLFHPDSDTLIPFRSDAKGQFAVALPDQVKGRCMIFGMTDGEPSGAAVIDVP